MQVSAWHSTDDFFCTIRFSEETLSTIELGTTHLKLPVTLNIEADSEEALDRAFDHFNWVQNNFAAPDKVNNFCREYKTHASMSVGDVVELSNGSFWYCAPVGWKLIPHLSKGA